MFFKAGEDLVITAPRSEKYQFYEQKICDITEKDHHIKGIIFLAETVDMVRPSNKVPIVLEGNLDN